ncbi:uncharacterized protein MELLADRAFT_118406 [Melampsora larici-populina 98AG31]|uniref:Secreted protein n=1 Tax=Melampsora larici-populina (strain 98AG31 / pathotype 3-4-7) TaxID=747676 RepID=F4S8T7_MELLP|nr:uncharacterized protein MELLADRAFT_118406 [Melampsora larici-populina 98AG31]EGF98967.1 hypothetical protein MELLADRAFT_118406 [Melampsora larici-populina 98AG31]
MARLMIHSILGALFIVFGSVAADPPVINTPLGVAQCLPSSISFGQGLPPYYISVIPGGQPSAASLMDFPVLSESPYRWVVNQPVGTSITLRIRDSNGQLNYSQQVTVQPGNTDCLSGGGSTPAPAPAPTTPQPPATPNTTSANPPTTTGVSTPPTSNTSASMNTTPTKNTTTATNSTSSTNSTKGSSPFIAPANTTSTTPNTTTSSDNPAAAGANSAAATLGFSLSALSTPFVVGMIISLFA